MNNKNALGRHMLLELYACDTGMLKSPEKVQTILMDVAQKIGATVVDSKFHHFEPHGVSGVLILAESHITIHTWPEFEYAAIDLFTCNDKIDYNAAEILFVEQFCAQKHDAKTLQRGYFKSTTKVKEQWP